MMKQRNFEVRFLEGKVRRLERENAKLREERDTYRDLVGCMVHPDIPDQLYAENAKLRELVRDYEHCTMYADCAHCKYDGKLSTHCPLSPCFPDTDELRELGVGVVE